MFTGIIESTGKVEEIKKEGTNITFVISSDISHQLKIDQSLSHNGVCLTVENVMNDRHWVTAVEETLIKSNLGSLEVGSNVNLERSMPANGRFDGHIVQGHVDQMGKVLTNEEKEGSWIYKFNYEGKALLVEKGSITVNGVSLTCFETEIHGRFTVTIIPYTYENTNFKELKIGDYVNLEFDILGKYIEKLIRKE